MNKIQNKHQITWSMLILLAMLTALDALAIDIYLPAFPIIAESLQISSGQIQQTLSVFLIGLAIGQGLYGPLLDRFGRRIPLLIGLVLFILGSIIAALSTSIEILLIARFLQAIGAAAGLVTPRAIISDLCNEQDAARNFSILMQVMMVAPILAPILGGYILVHGSWQIIFYTLAVLATIILLWSIKSLPETLPSTNKQPLILKVILNNYQQICRNKSYLYFTLASGFLFGAFFFYISNSPYIFIQHYQINSSYFSYLFAFNAFCFIIFGQISIWLLSKKWSAYKILKLGLVIFLSTNILMVFTTFLYEPTITEYILMLGLSIWSTGFLFGNLTALTMQEVNNHLTGVASSFMGLIQYALGAAIGFIASLLPASITILPLTLLSCSLAIIYLCYRANAISNSIKVTSTLNT